MTIVTIIDMQGEQSLGRLDPMTGKVGEPYKRKEYVSEIEKGWREGAPTDIEPPKFHCDTCEDSGEDVLLAEPQIGVPGSTTVYGPCPDCGGKQPEPIAAAPLPELKEGDFIIGGIYLLRNGRLVQLKQVHSAGQSFETMTDEYGHHRYTKRDFGRLTGSPTDDPRNIVAVYSLPTAQELAQFAGEEK